MIAVVDDGASQNMDLLGKVVGLEGGQGVKMPRELGWEGAPPPPRRSMKLLWEADFMATSNHGSRATSIVPKGQLPLREGMSSTSEPHLEKPDVI